MGPGAFKEGHLTICFEAILDLLAKKAFCQTGDDDEMDDYKDSDESEDEEDLDHDEIILGNTTDCIISLAKALGAQFVPFLERLAPELYPYVGDEHPRSDQTMVIGCLAEVFNSCAAAIEPYFDTFYQLLIKFSVTDEGSLNRNVAYGIGVLARKAPPALFEQHVGTALQMVSAMYQASAEQDAKDNCMSAMLKMLERFESQIDPQQAGEIFSMVMGSIPLQGDASEN